MRILYMLFFNEPLVARIIPACPVAYHLPRTLDELIDQFVFRRMDVPGLKSPLQRRGDLPARAIHLPGVVFARPEDS